MSWKIFHQVPTRVCLSWILRQQTVAAEHATDLTNVHLCLFHKWIQLCAIIGWWVPEHLAATCLKTHPHTRNMCVCTWAGPIEYPTTLTSRAEQLQRRWSQSQYGQVQYSVWKSCNFFFFFFLKKVKCIRTLQMKHCDATEIPWPTNHI